MFPTIKESDGKSCFGVYLLAVASFIIVVFSFTVRFNFVCNSFMCMVLLTVWRVSGASRPLPR